MDEEHCECDFCQRGRKLRWIADKLAPSEREWLIDFGNLYVSISADAEYMQNVLNGSWPDSVKILERALAKAKEIEALEPTES